MHLGRLGRWLSFAAALAMATPQTWAGPGDWAEGLDDEDDGATRDFYNRGAGLAWRNANGDWIDADGTPQGDAAFAMADVADTDELRFITWDVTDLVNGWLDGSIPARGFFIRAVGGGGPIDIASREVETAAEHPQLEVDGAVLSAVADTYLEPSTYQAQGQNTRLRISGDQSTLVRFDLSGLSGPVSTATLRLWTTKQYGGGAMVGVFAAAPGRLGPAPVAAAGLAEAYPMDEGIGSHPDVVFHDNFEDPNWEAGWTSAGGQYGIADPATPEFGFTSLSGKALVATVPEGGNTALNLRYDFAAETGSEPEAIYMRYYLRLGSTWNQSVDGGKLPGISGTYGVAGWGGRKSDGTNGWSARGLFKRSVQNPGNPLAGHTPVGSYVYHADMEGNYGDNFVWVDAWADEGYGGVLDIDRWYCMETYVQLNTLGVNDGVIRGWVDGRLAYEKTDLRFRDVDSLKIERIWMNIYHGGTAASPYDQHAFIDHVVVAHSYIGPAPGFGVTTDPTPEPGPDAAPDAAPDAGAPTPDASASGDAAPPTSTPDLGSAQNPGDDNGCSSSPAAPGPLGLLMVMMLTWALSRKHRHS